MVVSRNDIKRKRKDSDTTLDTLPDSPKRTKVHAQRKFAQGSNVSSPVITPVKELDRDKIKCNEVIPTTELLPIKRPNTEDFLTFLCFRGTSVLPPNLHFFNSVPQHKLNSDSVKRSESATAATQNVLQEESSDRPFIAFGVRKRADPFISSKLDKKRRHALAVQALRRKYQAQRMAKIRAVTIEKMSEGIKIKSKNLVRTRSVARREADTRQKRNIKVVTKRMKIATRTQVKRPILKPKMCLRSRGRFIARELPSPVKKRPMKPVKVQPPKQDSSSEFSSDDDQPLVKALRKTNKTIKPAQKIVRKITSTQKKTTLIRLTRSAQSTMRLEACVSQRPPRKTKEAAAIYMELLGRKLVNDAEADDDEASIDSYPELPNVRRTEQRENEMKAKVHSVNKINTRNMAAAMKLKKSKRNSEAKNLKSKNAKPAAENNNDSDNNSTKSEEKDTEKDTKKVLRSRSEKPTTRSNQSKVQKNDDANKNKTESFSDSDEEPLVKLTTQHKLTKQTKNKTPTTNQTETKPTVKKQSENKNTAEVKCNHSTKTEPKPVTKSCTSDDDEEKAFRGFVQPNNMKQTNAHESKCVHKVAEIQSPGADLLCKDVGRRFGKGKVNMSTEQIEKWLKESALAGEASKKELFGNKTEDDILKYEEKDMCKEKPSKQSFTTNKTTARKPIELPTTTTVPLETTPPKTEEKFKVSEAPQKDVKSCTVTPIISAKAPPIAERKFIFQQRRSIINKDRKEISPNTKAFSPDNESSVYAFEADMELPISTPFRSHVRRPSSTATSRSEDDASKHEEDEKRKSHDGKFRLPAVVKPTSIRNQGKQEMSLTLSNDDVNNSASIAVQVNLNSDTGFVDNNVSMECSTQTDAGDEDADGHLFYIPLQAGRQASSNQQIIQGVAVKLGTEVSDGVNQRVVMRAKLVTQTPDRLPLIGPQQKPLAQSTLMYPPVGTVQPTYRPKPLEPLKPIGKALPEPKVSNDFQPLDNKQMVPSSPSASSSSSAKIYKRTVKPRARSLDMCVPVNSIDFPSRNGPAQLVEAPTFHPSEKEFQDPMEFIEKIRSHAERFGICRIIPPANFKPECKVSDDMRFTAYNQYVHKMLHRWGPNFKELMAIKKYLKTQSITFTHPPWIGGMEIDLPRLYQTVQSLGGLKEVIEKKRWPKVAEGMKIPKSAQDRVTKLDDIYCKYLLPYDTLSPAERQKLFDEVETEWAKRESRTLLRSERAVNVSTNSNESDSESGDDELDECIVKGRSMALNAFYRIARNTMSMWFKSTEPSAQEVEQEFWKHVTSRNNHLCVHSGSIDSSGWGYGFACSKNSPFARHPWNLKILTNNSGSILRSMGPIMGVTVPTLHVGMVFSACCWYRDPHGLPWIEYLHTGGNKIWYGIPDSFSDLFHATLTKLVPSYCRDKTIWLPSDTAMVPPSLLVQNGVSLCRTVQEPGQFIVVFPKAFTSSICSGYVVSESVYFAPASWLKTAQNVFKDIRDSCEPSMFSLERLLLSVASDTRSNSEVLKQILPIIQELREREKSFRDKLDGLGLKNSEKLPLPECPNTKKKRKMQEDDGEYECEICRANLYVSLVTDSHEEGVYCLDHAVEHIKTKPDQLKYCKLMFTYSIQDLDNLLEKIRSNIENKTALKKPIKLFSRAAVLK